MVNQLINNFISQQSQLSNTIKALTQLQQQQSIIVQHGYKVSLQVFQFQNIQISMAQGPNFIALSAFKAQSHQTFDEQPSSTNNLAELERILQNNRQFEIVMKNIKKQFNYLGDANTQITQFYPQFITSNTYEEDIQKTVIYDDSISELILKLEKQNQGLKQELRVWMQQFGKKAHLTQLLIKQNKTLQSQVILQDKDILQIINTLGGKQSQELKQLQDQMNHLKEQNGLLLQHLSGIQQEIQQKKQMQSTMCLSIQNLANTLNQTKQKFLQTSEEQDHQTKMFAMLKNIVDNLTLSLSELDAKQMEIKNLNLDLKNDKQELTQHLHKCKSQLNDIKTNVISQNNQKSNQQKKLKTSIAGQKEQLKYSNEKIKRLENDIAREGRFIEQYSKATEDADRNLKNINQRLKSAQANLNKQLQKQTQRGSQVMTLRYQIQLLEGQINLIKNHRKQQQQQFPTKIKNINDEFQQQKNRLEKQILELDADHIRTLNNLKNEATRQKVELQRAQRDLQMKNQDLKEAKDSQLQIKKLKSIMKELGSVLKQKVIQANGLK